uniref:FCH domain-containing protein n=1 Tax=Timema douglasi TaxID=61478 RepID=A0A7R8Z3G2_TIMDO|nr:unnamed protein product [Timema douglasi]
MAVTSDSQNLGVYLNVDCQKSAVGCQSAPKKPWGYCRFDTGDKGSKNQGVDIRVQLTEQLRCLDVRMESQVALVAELQDYFRRRAEVELDYSKNLDKLAKSLQLRHKEQRQK